jgi:hypothetical protein
MFFLPVYTKALFAGFMNGIFLGRKIRNVKYIHRFQYNPKEQPYKIKGRVGEINTSKE